MTALRLMMGLLLVCTATQAAPKLSLVIQEPWNDVFGGKEAVFHVLIVAREAVQGRVVWRYSAGDKTIARQEREVSVTPGRPENVVAGTADKWLWEVYGLGKRGRREGVIYTAWTVEDRWPDRMACQRWGYGVDWGFAQDPCAVVECALFHGDLWLREAVYEKELVIRQSDSLPDRKSLVGRLKEAGVDPAARMHCDGARPDCVADLRIGGYSFAFSSDKRAGSVMEGIALLSGWRMRVHRGSQNIQRELEQYSWRKNRQTGEWMGEPEDANNHAMDAVRYWALSELRGAVSGAGVYTAGNQEAETCLTRY